MLFRALRTHVVTELGFGTLANVNLYFLPIASVIADVLAKGANWQEALHDPKPFSHSAGLPAKPGRDDSQKQHDTAMDDSVDNGHTNAPRDLPQEVEAKTRKIEKDGKADRASQAGIPRH